MSKLGTHKQLVSPLNAGKFRSHFALIRFPAASQGSQIKRVSQSSSTGDPILMWLAITWNDSIANPLWLQSSHWIRLAGGTRWTDAKKKKKQIHLIWLWMWLSVIKMWPSCYLQSYLQDKDSASWAWREAPLKSCEESDRLLGPRGHNFFLGPIS